MPVRDTELPVRNTRNALLVSDRVIFFFRLLARGASSATSLDGAPIARECLDRARAAKAPSTPVAFVYMLRGTTQNDFYFTHQHQRVGKVRDLNKRCYEFKLSTGFKLIYMFAVIGEPNAELCVVRI